jgi:sulfite reductase beta subunit-like hemoprotein
MPDGLSRNAPSRPPSGVERVKAESRGLRGGILAELDNPALPSVSEATYGLLKFHGTYEQYDRDTATELKQAGHEKDWQFMVRIRAPAGRLSPAQYLELDRLADRYGNASLRVTTRQTIQFHGVAKGNLRAHIAAIEASLLTTFATCGDVARNVLATPAPIADRLHRELDAAAQLLSSALLPRTRAHHDIFIAAEDSGDAAEDEPLYGPTYLPRKFKIALAHPLDNTVDLLSNDLGFLAETDSAGAITHWIVTVGGGQGMTHNKSRTYPRLASAVARIPASDLLRAAEAVVRFTRDFGDRSDRKRARLKYVIDDVGLAAAKTEIEQYFGAPLEAPPPLPKLAVPDHLGWHPAGDGTLWLGLPVASGRIADTPATRIRSYIRSVVERFGAGVILSPLQDVLLTGIAPSDQAAITRLAGLFRVTLADQLSPLSRTALACPALPTCGLALAEAERTQPALLSALDAALMRHGLAHEPIVLRVTGCPNGCARPYTGEIGIVGRMPGRYALYLGGDREGTRLSFKVHDRIDEAELPAVLESVFAAFAAGRLDGEAFGDFCARLGPQRLQALSPMEQAA